MVGVDFRGFEADAATSIWRYMSVERFHDVLGGHLYFAAATQFDDPFEGAITDTEQARRRAVANGLLDHPTAVEAHLRSLSSAFEDLRRMTKINCWHASPNENVAMWERYLRGHAGVAIRSTVGALKRSLNEFRLKPEYGEEVIVVGRVHYIDFGSQEMLDRSMLGIFLHKRIEYRDESEIRALLSLRMASEFGVPIPDSGVNVGVDPRVLIHELRARNADDRTLADLSAAVARAGVTAAPAHSSLTARPVY